ncbi:helix-turn-helix domain-containing protein [Thioclava sp. F36-7]|uniref:helix-turn-helix domain-containing protein n=1 Tax=Thioclava sp. F36-7 TaxID=1915317 RepID=UPI0009961747|nr:helix-turn-helix domain-containing protein [Thioclava sp. F36-7]OOY08582.1 helix-turn-helix domain-containing protein [Thioclava sp. F36-7]
MIGRRAKPSTGDEVKPKGFDDFELRLGDVMRGERATLAKSLLDVQRELRIKAAYIAAIEACDVEAFDTPSFIAGYVRSYARYLGLDPEWSFQRFCNEAGYSPAHGMSEAASGPKPQRDPKDMAEALANPAFIPRKESLWTKIEPRAVGALFVLALIGGGIGYGGWTVLQEVQRVQLTPVDQAPGVMADLDPLDSVKDGPEMAQADDTLPEVNQPERSARIYRPAALDAPVLVSRDGPIASIDPNATGALAGQGVGAAAPGLTPNLIGLTQPSTSPNTPQGTQLASAAGPENNIQSAVAKALGADQPDVVVLAVRPSWVRIKSADGATLFEKVMDAGERYVLPKLEEAPTMRTGESGAIYFAVNGVTHGPVGKRGQVTKNIKLSSAALDEDYPVANLAQDKDLAKMIAVADAGDAAAPAQTDQQ